MIRTKFHYFAPETYLENDYCPEFGGNHEVEINRKNIDASTNIK